GRDSVRYSYGGLSFGEPSQGRTFSPSSKTLPDLALINISDPFAGYGNEDVSLISNYSGAEKMGGDYTYATRDQRYYRIVAKHQLPREIGSVYGSFSYESLGDAAPRWNVDCRLPHNGAENVELMGGASFDLLTKFKSDVKVLYKSVKRDYYEHCYYFDYEHAPREEFEMYNGELSVNGWLMKDLFINAGFGIAGDDSKTGDGVLFDDVAAYAEQRPNPGTDLYYLFYRWDDFWTVTETIDEAHYYDAFKRYKSSAISGFLQLKKQIKYNAEIWSDFEFSKSTFRKYVNYYPTVGYNTEYVDNIGFDALGNETNDENGFADIPNPMWLTASLGGKLLEDKYFIKGAIDFELFDPGALVFRDPLNPLDPDGVNDYQLDTSDMTDADIKSNVGFRAAVGISLTESIDLFGNASISYAYPSYNSLYNGYSFMETRIGAGSYYIFSNPELDPVKYANLELGIMSTCRDINTAISYQRRLEENSIVTSHVSGIPYAYDMLASSGGQNSTNAIVLSCRQSGNHLLSGSVSAEIAWHDWYISTEGLNIAWMHPYGTPLPKQKFTTYKLSGSIGLNPNALDLDRDRLFGKVLSRLAVNLSFNYRGGLRYTLLEPYAAVSLGSVQHRPLSEIGAKKAKDFFEINLAIAAHLADFRGAKMSLSFEILNLFDRDNYLDVYGATGEPDYDGYDQTEEYDARVVNYENDPLDSSGLTFAEKYSLKQDDPNNYYRPRMFRILARLEF
ncbi:MAG: hypothetical protein DRP46_00005, partial [Candidatus Zixiibacteriota bacterium]